VDNARNIKLIIEYDGTGYHGWQSQVNSLAVQDVVTDSIKEITGEDCCLTGSSRTDAGAHATGFVANFKTNSRIPPGKFSYALNTVLPEDIVIKHSCEVKPDFHSRFSAKGKKYRYLIYNSEHPSALLRYRAYHVSKPLGIEDMKRASCFFKGTHDFMAFMASGSSVKTTVRTITDVSVERNGQLISFEITGDGFLYNMVRIMAGTLVETGLGGMKAESIEYVMKSLDRSNAGKTAPAHGLYLVEVYY
jgi:tRNA pseudouridine38-40 synthase